MLKQATNKEKFSLLKEWHPHIFEEVKKDIKNEHLKQDPVFFKMYFNSKNLHKITTEELVEGYRKAVEESEKGEEIAEFISNSWLLKYGDIYQHFEKELSKVQTDFTAIQELDSQNSLQIIEGSIQQFGAPQTYLFSVFNSVVFPKEIFKQLNDRAKKSLSETAQKEQHESEKQTLEALKKHHEREMARVTDKYEKKLSGLQRKYCNDVDSLKKQLSNMQKKLKV